MPSGKAAASKHRCLTYLLLFITSMLFAVMMPAARVYAAREPLLVQDIVAGSASADPRLLAELPGFVLFEAYDATLGWQLWRSDGTAIGTTLIADLSPEPNDSQYNLTRPIAEMGGSYYFSVDGPEGTELWKSDGTSAGTLRIGDVRPAGPDGIEKLVPGIVFQGKLFFLVNSFRGSGDVSTLWFTDGTVAGTAPLEYEGSENDLVADLVIVGDKLFFRVIDTFWEDGADRTALYSSDGTAAGTLKLLDDDLAQIRYPVAGDGLLFFSASSRQKGQELWISDGTVAGTKLLKDTVPGREGDVSGLVRVGTLVLFTSGVFPQQNLWRSDGTEEGTFRIKNFIYGNSGGWFLPYGAHGTDGAYYFIADDGVRGTELWRSDGSAAGTTLVKDTVPGRDNSGIGSLFMANGLLYFLVGEFIDELTLWRSDGTSAGTYAIQRIGTLPGFSSFSLVAPFAEGVSFVVGTENGQELWYSEGEAGSTGPLRDPASGELLLINPAFPFDVNELAYSGKAGTTWLFGAATTKTGFELWRLGDLPIGRVRNGLLALYDFEEANGIIVHDTSGVEPALDLRVARSFTHEWVKGGLRLKGITVIRSSGAARKLIKSAKATNALTIEAWITPDAVEQFSSRIITISPNTTVRNFTLSQGSFKRQDTSEATFRLRSRATNNDGAEWTSGSGGLKAALTHVVVTIAPGGAIRFYLNGQLAVSGVYEGTFDTWNERYPLLLGNEALGGRGWKGTYYLVAFYDRALSANEVEQNFNAGP
jgi:ELWxxDGT repeat protein